MKHDDDFEAAVAELDAALVREFPDPVDVFEDDLAWKLGLRRGPGTTLDQWRRARVQFIDAADSDPVSQRLEEEEKALA